MTRLPEAIRRKREATVICPMCGAENKPNTKVIVELSADEACYCNSCGTFFAAPKDAA